MAAQSADSLLAILAGRERALHSLDALGTIRVEGESIQRKMRASQVVLVQAPDSFRIEVLAPFGVSYAVTSDGQKLTAAAPHENFRQTSGVDAASIAAATGVHADAGTVTALLLGRPPVQADELRSLWTSRHATEQNRPGEPEVFLHAAAGEHSVVIGFAQVAIGGQRVSVPVTFQRIARDGTRLLSAEFSDFAGSKGVLVPKRIEVLASGNRAEIHYREFDPNRALASDAFAIAPLAAP